MTNNAGVLHADPTNTFLTPVEVFRRYRWGRTKGYQMLRSPGFPRAIGGAYRLDTLRAWEECQLAGRIAPTPAEPAAQVDGDHPTAAAATTSATVPGTGTAPPATPDGEASWSPSTRRPTAGRARKSGGR